MGLFWRSWLDFFYVVNEMFYNLLFVFFILLILCMYGYDIK